MATQSIFILGNSKVNQSGITPAILESTNKSVLILTGKAPAIRNTNCVLINMHNFNYSVLNANSSDITLSDFCTKMDQSNTRVGVISKTLPLFSDALDAINGNICFSACREGLPDTYLPLLEKRITKPTHIFIFDNDEAIIEKAQAKSKNPNINFHKCIMHSVCNSMVQDSNTTYLTCGKECTLYFPPEAKDLKPLFKNNLFGGRSEFVFTESEEEFFFYKWWKKIGINSLHTLASVKAYVEGTALDISLDTIASSTFNCYVSKETLTTYLLRVYSILYDKYLANYSASMQVDKETLATSTITFISELYNSKDIVRRGLDITATSFHSKLESHFPLLYSSEDQETIDLLNEFKNYFVKR